jgi:hypothetical protein
MQLDALWHALESAGLSIAIRETPFAFAAVETVHVIALAVVFGSIAIVDLRLLGVASKAIPVSEMSKELLRWTWGAFALALVSGAVMFAARAPEYMVNKHFLLKFGVMALAGVNMAIFHFGAYRRIERWDLGPTPAAARVAGFASLAFWIVIVGLGRWIGYSLGMHF